MSLPSLFRSSRRRGNIDDNGDDDGKGDLQPLTRGDDHHDYDYDNDDDDDDDEGDDMHGKADYGGDDSDNDIVFESGRRAGQRRPASLATAAHHQRNGQGASHKHQQHQQSLGRASVGGGARQPDETHSDPERTRHRAQQAGYDEGRATWRELAASIFNLVSSVIGGGMLSIPFAFGESGVLVGMVVLVVMALCATHSAHLLVVSRRFGERAGLLSASDRGDYEVIAKCAFGPAAAYTVVFIMFYICLMPCIAYLILFADGVAPLMRLAGGTDFVLADRGVIMILAAVTLLPVTLLRSLSALKHTSAIGVFSAFFILLAVTIRFAQNGIATTVAMARAESSLFGTVSVLSVAFLCHFNLAQTEHELRRPSKGQLNTLLTSTFTISGGVYLLFGIVGYLQFGSAIQGNVFNNFSDSDSLINIARVTFALVMWTSYPLLAYPCRAALDQLLFWGVPWQRSRHVAETLFILSVTLICALYIPNVMTIWRFTGSTCTLLAIFVFPPLFYLKLRTPTVRPTRQALERRRRNQARLAEASRNNNNNNNTTSGAGIADLELSEPAVAAVDFDDDDFVQEPFYKDYSGLSAVLMLFSGFVLFIACTYETFRTL